MFLSKMIPSFAFFAAFIPFFATSTPLFETCTFDLGMGCEVPVIGKEYYVQSSSGLYLGKGEAGSKNTFQVVGYKPQHWALKIKFCDEPVDTDCRETSRPVQGYKYIRTHDLSRLLDRYYGFLVLSQYKDTGKVYKFQLQPISFDRFHFTLKVDGDFVHEVSDQKYSGDSYFKANGDAGVSFCFIPA